jgi:hypothetical protein
MCGVNPFAAANAVLRFVLELCMLAAVAYWGSRTSDSTVVAFGATAAVNTTVVHLQGEI